MESFLQPIIFENPCPGHATGLPGFMFTKVVQTLIAAQCGLADPNQYPKDYGDSLKDNDEFDFIVVGAGSAGAVIANRLTENENWKVLLLEAGGDPTFVSEIPAFLFSTQGTKIDWQYVNEPNGKSCLGMEGQSCCNPRGKALGGTSSINAMLYVRGNADDYDEWERLGNPGWSHENVLEYFKKSEKLQEDFVLVNDTNYDKNLKKLRRHFLGNDEKLYELSKMVQSDYHSKDGYLSVDHYSYDFLLRRDKNLYLKAVQELGLPTLSDINGVSQIGFTEAMGTLQDGQRANTAKMFLSPIKNRKNLFVVKNALVQKLIVTNNKVTGVQFVRNGETKVVIPKNEVIVSGGALNSPQLLMLSGIGPKAHLESKGIEVVKDLPGVGQNLQDHVVFFGALVSVDKSNQETISLLQKMDAIYEFLTRGTGLFANIGMTDLIGFIDTHNETNIPDIQFHHMLNHINETYLFNEFLHGLRIKREIKDQYTDFVKLSKVLVIAPTLLRPKSVGWIELSSSDPSDHPKIFGNYLSEQEDVDTIIRGIRFAEKLTKTENFKKLEPEWLRLKIEACDNFEFQSDEYWECLIRHLGHSLYHPTGTCKMGPSSDPLAVVDHKLKVYGVDNLRVADASIMPVIVRGNTNAPSIMIGEKAADLVKEDWTNSHTHTDL